MKNNLLLTTALVSVAFVFTASAVQAEASSHEVVTQDKTISGGEYKAGSETGVGGAILNSSTSSGHTLTLNNTNFTSNHSGTSGTGGGGAIYNNAKLVVNGGTFDSNVAGFGYGEGVAKVKSSSNGTGGNGGAIFNGEKGTLTVNNARFTNNEAKGKGKTKTGRGGAITTSGTADINNSTFEGNKAVAGGAVMVQGKQGQDTNTPKVTITGGRFANNTADFRGGAVYDQFGELTVTGGAVFENNEANEGGAISVYGGKSKLTVNGAQFIGNKTRPDGNLGGGAIYADAGTLEVANSIFDGNVAEAEGGAILSWAETTKISNSTFKNNKSMSGEGGGALYLYSETEIADSTFINNHSDISGAGGAIEVENDVTVKFSGNNVFKGNTQLTAKGKVRLNDIHISSDGKVVLQNGANVTLDGGIRGQNGTLKLQADSTLNVKDTTVIASKVRGGSSATGHINVVLTDKTMNNGGTLDITDIFTQESDGQTLKNVKNGLNFATNNLYDVRNGGGNTYTVTERSAGEAAGRLGVREIEAATLLATSSSKTGSGNSAFDDIQDTLRHEAQYGKNSELLSRSADALVADAAPTVRVRETALSNMIFDTATDAMDDTLTNAAVGQSSGDSLLDKAKVWVKGLFNYADKDDTSKSHGFDIDTYGLAFGMDKNVSPSVKLGAGYAYSQSDIDGYTRDTDVDTHTLFAYAKYKPANWYVNTVASYSFSDYKEKKSVLSYSADAKYDVDTFGLQSVYGYELNTNGYDITPEAGLRYLHIAKDGYVDELGTMAVSKNTNVLTAIAGVKAAKTFELSNGMNIRPEVRAAVTYDLTSNNNDTRVVLPNGEALRVAGE